ncbi:hypothetical protein AVEN_114187-1 [Araneus ventricosus]|uniref:Uncharacterized protein n=1 Tax=Araneus ventricosus TaxID=182803 RepID=A0A4Y2RA12_ARAVE|nr:hypothetical protein AVEN_114187-1 [Araneus ventricosus]
MREAAETTNQHARNVSIVPIPVKVGIMPPGLTQNRQEFSEFSYSACDQRNVDAASKEVNYRMPSDQLFSSQETSTDI